MFVMLDPTTFPITISDEPRCTENTEETSSGRDVPIDTMVTPTIKGGSPKWIPIFSADSVKNPEALIRIIRLKINIATQTDREYMAEDYPGYIKYFCTILPC
jgi:hypothetical protein